MRIWLTAFLFSISSLAQAEVFYDLKFSDTFHEVRQKYPNATFTNINTAWLKPSQALISMTGAGIKSTVVMLFERIRTGSEDQDVGGDLYLWNVRIVYKKPVPIEEFKKKYGAPSRCFKDEDFDSYCEFRDRALTASLSSDGKFVPSLISYFTVEEQKKMAVDSITRSLKRTQEIRNAPVEAPAAAPATDQ